MHRLVVAALIVAAVVAPRTAFAQSAPASPGPVASPGAVASPGTVASPGAAASPDPAVTARAKDWLHRAQTGTLDRAQLSPQMNALLTDDLVKHVSTQLGPLGDPTDFTLVDMRNVAGSNVYMYKAQFKSSLLEEIISIDDSGKINGLRFLPAR